MKFFRDFFNGIANFFKAFGVAFEKGLWPYMFIPLALQIIFTLLLLWGFVEFAIFSKEWVNEWLGLNSIPNAGHWLSFAKPVLVGWLGGIISWLLGGIVGYVLSFFIKYIILILLSPLMALISELTESKLTGKKYPFIFKQFLKDIRRGVLINLRNMLIEFFFIGLSIPLLIVNVIPVVGQIIWILYFYVFLQLLSWYFTGFALMDYNNERHKLNVSQSARLVRKNKGYAIGIGMCYWFCFWMLGMSKFGAWFGIIFAPVVGTIAATISYLDIKKTEEQKNTLPGGSAN